MPFESGTIPLIICSLSGKLPEDVLARLENCRAGRLDDVQDQPLVGWVSGRHLLETEINDVTAIAGGHLYVNLRKAERKIPASLLNAICRREELAFIQANDSPSGLFKISRKEKKRIREEAIARNLMKMPPSISAIPVVVDRASNIFYAGTSSLKAFDLVAAEFRKAVDVEPIPLTVRELMFKHFQRSESDLPNLSFNGRPCGEATPGRDFLTWLWYYAETGQGLLQVRGLGGFNVIVEGPLTFAIAGDEAPGASESTVKKGCPQMSAEAKAALAVGKKLRKAKILLAHGDMEKWSFTFDADAFTFSGVSLPETETMEFNSMFEERVTFLDLLRQAVEAYFKRFAEEALNDDPARRQARAKWAAERDSR